MTTHADRDRSETPRTCHHCGGDWSRTTGSYMGECCEPFAPDGPTTPATDAQDGPGDARTPETGTGRVEGENGPQTGAERGRAETQRDDARREAAQWETAAHLAEKVAQTLKAQRDDARAALRNVEAQLAEADRKAL